MTKNLTCLWYIKIIAETLRIGNMATHEYACINLARMAKTAIFKKKSKYVISSGMSSQAQFSKE